VGWPVFCNSEFDGTQNELATDGDGNSVHLAMDGLFVIERQVEIDRENQAVFPDKQGAFATPEPEQTWWKTDGKFFNLDIQQPGDEKVPKFVE
jgi:hypothetical protein